MYKTKLLMKYLQVPFITNVLSKKEREKMTHAYCNLKTSPAGKTIGYILYIFS